MSRSESRKLQLLLGVVVSAVCAAFAVRGVEWRKLADALWNIDGRWLIIAVVANATAMIAGGFRWRVVARPNARLSRLDAVEILMIGSFVNLIVSRAGDFARAILTARRGQQKVAAVLGSMVVDRFADVALLLAIAAGISAWVDMPRVIRIGLSIVALTTVAAVPLIWCAEAAGTVVRRVIAIVSPTLAAVVAGALTSLSAGLRVSVKNGQIMAIGVWTVVIWGISTAAIVCSLKALALPVPWFAALFVLVVTNLGGVLPSSPGAIGVYHYLAVVALSPWLLNPSTALAFAIVSHALNVVVTVSCGSISLVRQGFGFRGLVPSMWTASAPTTINS
jgi:uncharacterized protein (TIRG00374 family)